MFDLRLLIRYFCAIDTRIDFVQLLIGPGHSPVIFALQIVIEQSWFLCRAFSKKVHRAGVIPFFILNNAEISYQKTHI
ncbi:hypothetical protein GALL_515080 [mine drainage metagenome]|uniref:Uncharacterized protein n=1 Tax=mine drainage metagenome TaxID=410659 RepID=A0A1J5P854_9ZZZZ